MGIRCGVDIIEINRIKETIEHCGNSFLERVFSTGEIEFCKARNLSCYQSYAARFAAKEAVSKALGTGFTQGVSFKDIEVISNENGNPNILLKGQAQKAYENIGGIGIDISMSHCRDYAIAQAVIQIYE